MSHRPSESAMDVVERMQRGPEKVVLHRLHDGDYGVTIHGRDYLVSRHGDAASTSYVWDLFCDGERLRDFLTLAEVRTWLLPACSGTRECYAKVHGPYCLSATPPGRSTDE